MTMKDIENLRRAEIIAFMSASVLTTLSNMDSNSLSLLNQNSEIIHIISQITNFFYITDIYTCNQTVKIASDYKELKSMYNEAIENIAKFYKELGLNNCLSVAATYQYMYRSGYLSRNKQFIYSSNMKDIPNLEGIDITRGTGVCRSISSMLVDIYRKLGYESHGLSVRVENGMPDSIESNTTVEMNSDEGSERLVKASIGISTLFRVANHVITSVSSDNEKVLLCPTNGFVLEKDRKKIQVADQPSKKCMKYSLFSDLIGNFKTSPYTSFKELTECYSSPENHKEIMQNTAEWCDKNMDAFEYFHEQNKDLYHDLGALADEKSGMLERLFPLLPKKKK